MSPKSIAWWRQSLRKIESSSSSSRVGRLRLREKEKRGKDTLETVMSRPLQPLIRDLDTPHCVTVCNKNTKVCDKNPKCVKRIGLPKSALLHTRHCVIRNESV